MGSLWFVIAVQRGTGYVCRERWFWYAGRWIFPSPREKGGGK